MSYADPSANLVSGATMTSHVASTAVRRDSVTRTGGGIVGLSGSYTGDGDATYDVEVTSSVISGDPQISAPVAETVGNGTISAIAADPGSNAQTIKVTLVDLGIKTLAAFAPFLNVTLRAADTGPAGNGIELTVDRSSIVHTPTNYALPEAMTPGDNELTGEQWNFGGKTLNADGTIPDDTVRISFGKSSTIYRQYREFKEGKYRYKLTPALDTNHPQGTRVNVVTGTYTADLDITVAARVDSTAYAVGDRYIPDTPNGHHYECTVAGTSAGSAPTFTTDGSTFTDGTATFIDKGLTNEPFTNIQTVYDLLTKIQAASVLVDVDGPVAVDTAPGGMAIVDLNVHTGSFVQSEQRSGTDYILDADVPLTVSATSPTEKLRIKCIQANRIGEERWDVYGDVSGSLAEAVTGVLYSNGGYSFTIPTALGPEIPPEGFKNITYALSTGASGCHENFVLGAQARTQTYKFRWVERGTDCFCDTSTIAGGPNPEHLGVDPTIDPAEANLSSTLIAANILTRRKAITTWAESFISSQITVSLGDAGDGIEVPVGTGFDFDESSQTTKFRGAVERASALVKIDEVEVGAAERVAKWLRECLNDIDEAFPETFPAAAGTAFDSLMTTVSTEFGAFAANAGAAYWARINDWVLETTGGGTDTPHSEWQDAETGALKTFISSNARPYLITSFEGYVRKFKPKITKVYEEAGLNSPFDDASGAGSGVWQDHGGTGWFVSDDGYLPIQPGYYYHSARMEDDGTGAQVPTSTQEFGVGIQIGCPSELQPGDTITIEISDVSAPGLTYQPGDAILSFIVRADPVAFGGGQDGNDTLTFRVEGTVDAFDDYELDLNSPAAYDNNDLSFLITEGAIPFALEDSWTFALEGGAFRWRKDGGSYTTGVDIAPTVALSDGLSAVFTPGLAPSFAVGDAYSFTAIASNGPVRLETPDSTAARWTSATTITTDAASFDSLMIWHDMASACSVTLQGSDDDFSSTPLSIALPWTRDVIAYQWTAAQNYAKIRLVITGGDGRIYWWWAGDQTKLLTRNNNHERGILALKPSRRKGGSGSIEHTGLAAASVDSMIALLRDVETANDGRIGYFYGTTDGRVVRVSADPDVTDEFGHQPLDRANRLQTLSLPIEVVA